MFQRVADFHRVCGHPVADHPTLPEQIVRELRVRLLQEEVAEFHTASDAQDRVEMADALADICYIIAGTAVTYGVGPTERTIFESPYDQYLPNAASFALDARQLLQDCLVEYETAEHNNNISSIDLALMSMLTSVFGIAWHLNIPINAVFAEVHRSNLSKLLPDGTALRRADNKILKGPNWSPPAIAAILAGK